MRHKLDEDTTMSWSDLPDLLVDTEPDVNDGQPLLADETLTSPLLLFVLSVAAGFAFTYAVAGWLF